MVLKNAQQQDILVGYDPVFDAAMADDGDFVYEEGDDNLAPAEDDQGYLREHKDHDDEEDHGIVLVDIDDPHEEELVFSLPFLPGADDDSEFVGDDSLEVAEPEDVEVEEKDRWDWQSGGLGNFLNWLLGMMNDVPRHSGRDTTGLEKAIAYFEALDREITKAMRSDYRDEINSAKAEEARAQIENGLERLVERLENVKSTKYKRHAKKKKKAEELDSGLVKEAQKISGVHGVIVTVPLLISRIARVCINGTVSAGHDIEDLFAKQAEMYNLTNREKAEVVQLLEDMGYPVRRDRMHPFDETYDPKRSDNGDWAANYPD